MVNVSIDVTDLGGEARPGDKVVFWRPRMGGSATHAGRVISTAPVTVFLTDGKATVSDVEPGEMTVLLQCRGMESQGPITVGVPDGDGTVTLRALLESQFEYAPPIVSAVQEAADRASDAERGAVEAQERSEAAADRVGTAEQVGTWARQAQSAADRIGTAEQVEGWADSAHDSADAAAQSESSARQAEAGATSAAASAKTSETNSKTYEANARSAADRAEFAAEETIQQVEGDFATRNYVDQRVPFSSFTGTGSPEGNVAAPVGSVYIDSSATNGAIRWIKTQGAGATGWKVEYGDTNIRSLPRPEVFKGGEFSVSRNGVYVNLIIHAATLGSTLPAWTSFMTLPPGFRTATSFRAPAGDAYLDVVKDGRLAQISTNLSAGKIVSLGVVYRTNDPWPTSLPGTPA